MSLKAQVLSFDFIIAASIFLLVVGIIYIYWVYSNMQIEETKNINDMTEKAYTATQVWFREGVPEYWDNNTIIDLGLENEHRFNQTKMNMMETDIGYNNTKIKIGLGGYEYNFSIYNSTEYLLWSFGQSLPSNSQNIVNVKRIGILNGSVVILKVVVWK